MPDDQHPAQGLIDTIRGIFNGETFAKGIRDAWDRHMESAPAPASPVDNSWHDSMVSAANASFQRAAQNKLTPASASAIRAKASGKMSR